MTTDELEWWCWLLLALTAGALAAGALCEAGESAPDRSGLHVPDAAVRHLEREKTDRYSSVSAFGDALRAIRLGEQLPRDVAARLNE